MPAPKILFRADASLEIGTGHVMRCLTLAKALHGAECSFACREHQGNLIDHIRAQGFQVHVLPIGESRGDWLGASWQEDAAQTAAAGPQGWLIVDHYALDARWETAMRPHATRIMAIDDLADRPHDCDLLLDQNLGRKPEDYAGLVPDDCRLLLGPSFALLRPEFAQWREQSLARRGGGFNTLLITMGGVDQHNVTGDILAAFKGSTLPEAVEIKVVMGPHAPWLSEVKAAAATLPWPCEVLVGVSNMAELMAGSDLAIGAAGSTSWERCCLGLPTLALVLADNQREIAMALGKAGAAIILSDTELDIALRASFSDILADDSLLAQLSLASARVTDGTGSKRVANVITEANL